MCLVLTVIVAFNSDSMYLDYLLNIDTPYFEQMVSQILHLNKTIALIRKPPFCILACPQQMK